MSTGHSRRVSTSGTLQRQHIRRRTHAPVPVHRDTTVPKMPVSNAKVLIESHVRHMRPAVLVLQFPSPAGPYAHLQHHNGECSGFYTDAPSCRGAVPCHALLGRAPAIPVPHTLQGRLAMPRG